VRRQLALAAAAIASMIVIAFVVPLCILVRTIAQDRALASAEQGTTVLAPAIATEQDPRKVGQVVASTNTGDPAFVTVFLAEGGQLGQPIDAEAVRDEVQLARNGRSFSTSEPDGTAIYVPVVRAGGTDVIRSFVPDEVARRGVTAAWLLLGSVGLMLVLVATVVGDRLARSILRPVRDLADTAESLSHGDLDARVEPSGAPEIVEVGQTLNQLAGRIEGLLTAERESVADLSHRLRTPITALRLDIEGVAGDEERSRLLGDITALEDAVTDLINAARRTTEGATATSCDLVEVTTERFGFWSPLAEDQGRTFELDVSAGPTVANVTVPRDDLSAALDALIGNVLAHTPDGTSFAVRLAGRADGDEDGSGDLSGTRSVIVEDEGPGFDDLDQLGRGHSGGGSTGLGLDIVRQTAEASGGSVVIGRSPSGGARVEARFGCGP
jgi:signal transduction histidine kinase